MNLLSRDTLINTRKKIINIVAFLLALPTILFLIGVPLPIRFNDPFFNYVFVSIAAILFPMVTIYWSLHFKKDLFKVIGVSSSALLYIPVILLLIVNVTSMIDIKIEGVDSGFERLKHLSHGQYEYVLYRTNGGVTTSFALVLRKEKPLFAGMKTVERVYRKYRAREASLEIIDARFLQLNIEPYGAKDKAETVAIDIKG